MEEFVEVEELLPCVRGTFCDEFRRTELPDEIVISDDERIKSSPFEMRESLRIDDQLRRVFVLRRRRAGPPKSGEGGPEFHTLLRVHYPLAASITLQDPRSKF